jgi:hypothetical protein
MNVSSDSDIILAQEIQRVLFRLGTSWIGDPHGVMIPYSSTALLPVRCTTVGYTVLP